MVTIMNSRFILCFICLVCAGALGAAYIGEHLYNLKPCMLCYYQRYLFMLILFIGALGYLMTKERQRIAMIYLSGAFFMINAGVAVYQVLVEKKWVTLPQVCKNTKLATTSFANFKESLISKGTLPPCDQVSWELFGISMAGYNALFTLLLGMSCLFMASLLLLKLRMTNNKDV